jgi:hypothetical protein
MNTRRALKRAHDENSEDAHSGVTPAAKRLHFEEQGLGPESETDETTSPSATASLIRLRSIPPHPMSKKQTAQNTPQTQPPTAMPNFLGETTPDGTITTEEYMPDEDMLPMAFTETAPPADKQEPPPPPPPAEEVVTDNMEMEEEKIVDPFTNMLDWDEDTDNTVEKVLSHWSITNDTQYNATLPDQPEITGEWHIIRLGLSRPDLAHQSDNPFDFLPAGKLDSIIRYIAGQQVDEKSLSSVEQIWLGRPRIRKILVKVVHSGPTPLGRDRKTTWIRAATCSAIAQSGGKVAQFNRSNIAIDPMKPGYGWIIVPVGAKVFKVLEGVRGALDPKSGTLVLFRFWEEESCPKLRVFAIGLHLVDNDVSYEVATTDYQMQTAKALTGGGVRILEMRPAHYGESSVYSTEITLGYTEGTIPFPFNPTKLTRHFWTGPNVKRARYIEYRWPAKCRTCESEAHVSGICPWPNLEINGRKPSLTNCRFHPPGWVETSKGQKKPAANASAGFLNIGPKNGKPGKDGMGTGKGKGHA